MISTFQRNRNFRKVSVSKTFTHVHEQKNDVAATFRLYSVQCKITFKIFRMPKVLSTMLENMHRYVSYLNPKNSMCCQCFSSLNDCKFSNDYKFYLLRLKQWRKDRPMIYHCIPTRYKKKIYKKRKQHFMEVVFLGIWVLGSILHTYPPIIF